MSYDEYDLIERLHAVAEGFEMPPAAPADDVWRGRRRVRRNRGLLAGAAAATVAVVIGVTAAVGGQDRAGSDGLEPVERPGVVGDVPVWFDATGLHRGDVVEQTPIELGGAMALVRTGAVYLDPATGDVWFHPWGGDPRIVGHDSEAGPSGDSDGDIAVWFEGSDALNAGPGELVVYDTAADREVSRTSQSHGVTGTSGDHYPSGNTFLQVSAERVVWRAHAKVYSHDVRTRTTSVISAMSEDLRVLADLHDDVELVDSSGALAVRVPGRPEERYPDLESHVRLSPSGNYVLAVEGTDERHAAAILHIRTGELWRVPEDAYPWIAWSYGDIALVDTEDALLACDVARRTCQSLHAERPFLMPTN